VSVKVFVLSQHNTLQQIPIRGQNQVILNAVRSASSDLPGTHQVRLMTSVAIASTLVLLLVLLYYCEEQKTIVSADSRICYGKYPVMQ